MKYITKYKSPNYNSREYSKIKIIVIHYTALKNTQEAISYLCKRENKVSAHYLISQEGSIYSLVNEKFRAWHAGKSFWQDYIDINSISIGIELDYSKFGKNNKFSSKMIFSLRQLIHVLKKKYKINLSNVLAHSDISPFRKKDPGKYFPWSSLYSSNMILNFKNIKKRDTKILEEWFYNYNIKSKKQIIIFALSLIGYDTRQVTKNSKLYNKLINAYKIRYFSKNDYEKNKLIYIILLKHLLKFMLTKN